MSDDQLMHFFTCNACGSSKQGVCMGSMWGGATCLGCNSHGYGLSGQWDNSSSGGTSGNWSVGFSNAFGGSVGCSFSIEGMSAYN